jgi:hypothetical protein
VLAASLLAEVVAGTFETRGYLLPEYRNYVYAAGFALYTASGPASVIAAAVRTRLRGLGPRDRIADIERWGLTVAAPLGALGILLIAGQSSI